MDRTRTLQTISVQEPASVWKAHAHSLINQRTLHHELILLFMLHGQTMAAQSWMGGLGILRFYQKYPVRKVIKICSAVHLCCTVCSLSSTFHVLTDHFLCTSSAEAHGACPKQAHIRGRKQNKQNEPRKFKIVMYVMKKLKPRTKTGEWGMDILTEMIKKGPLTRWWGAGHRMLLESKVYLAEITKEKFSGRNNLPEFEP
jgi:hypothetical protein